MEEEISLPQRNDPNGIYKEIENFKDYELTNCIAYEMAIRNDEVISLKNLLIKTQFEYLEKDKDVEGFTKEFFDLFDYYNKKEKIILKKLEKFGFDEFTLLPIRVDFKDGIKIKKSQNLKEITTIIDYEYPKNTVFGNSLLKKKSDSYDYAQYALRTGQLEDENEIKANFKSRFRNPILKFKHNEFNLKINPNLPKEELIAYISKIKEEYDRDNSILKSPLELLGEKINIKTIKFKEMTSKEWADCFFIYDYLKASTDKQKGTKFQKLQELLTEYNGIKIEKTKEELRKSKNRNDNSKYKIVSFKVYNELRDNYVHKKIKPFYSLATIEDRLKLMTSLIDDLGYKTLIS